MEKTLSLSLQPFYAAEKPRAQTYNRLEEKVYDVAIPFFHHLEATLLGPFQRPIRLCVQAIIYYKPSLLHKVLRSRFRQITDKTIEAGTLFPEGSLPTGEASPSPERLRHVLRMAQELAQKAKIGNPIALYTSPESCPTGCVGHASATEPVPILIDLETIRLPDDELAFVLAHELMHLKHRDSGRGLAFCALMGVVDLVALLFFPLISLFLVEGLGVSLEYDLSKRHEKAADLGAVELLGTNRGAVSLWNRWLERMQQFKYSSVESLKQTHPSYRITAKELKTRQRKITPEGNNRLDFRHPPISERLAYCKAWTPGF
jgi:Zn-dependent protease with chaperone function